MFFAGYLINYGEIAVIMEVDKAPGLKKIVENFVQILRFKPFR
jgi:hypothetical protein